MGAGGEGEGEGVRSLSNGMPLRAPLRVDLSLLREFVGAERVVVDQVFGDHFGRIRREGENGVDSDEPHLGVVLDGDSDRGDLSLGAAEAPPHDRDLLVAVLSTPAPRISAVCLAINTDRVLLLILIIAFDTQVVPDALLVVADQGLQLSQLAYPLVQQTVHFVLRAILSRLLIIISKLLFELFTLRLEVLEQLSEVPVAWA